jgi:Rieske Fe-S protein
MRDMTDRRDFLSRMWKWGAGLIAAAGAWTSWDLLRPALGAVTGGKIRTVAADSVPERGVVEVTAARAYLTRIGDEVVALSEKCTHLGCRVPWCETSSQFECPCHGSAFNRAGDYRAGPAPRGLDRFAVSIEDGIVFVDTDTIVEGNPPGVETIDEPVTGPSCEGDH